MPAARPFVVVVALALMSLLACSQEGDGQSGNAGGAGGAAGSRSGGASGAPAGGAGGGGAVDAPAGEMAATDLSPRPLETCADIRYCRFRCGSDTGCVSRCVSGAPTAARMKYQTLETCSRAKCPTAEEGCRCENECIAPNDCIDLLEDCLGGNEDPFCESCH